MLAAMRSIAIDFGNMKLLICERNKFFFLSLFSFYSLKQSHSSIALRINKIFKLQWVAINRLIMNCNVVRVRLMEPTTLSYLRFLLLFGLKSTSFLELKKKPIRYLFNEFFWFLFQLFGNFIFLFMFIPRCQARGCQTGLCWLLTTSAIHWNWTGKDKKKNSRPCA